jgi:hypothetical protein
MKEYRALVLTREGNVIDLHELTCLNEEEAKGKARRLAESDSVELWEGARRIARFNPTY